MTNELTTRQQTLYKLFLNSRGYVLGRDLISSLIGYGRAEETCGPANSTAYRAIRKDIEAIKWSSAQYTIVSVKEHGKLLGYTLGDRKEVYELIESLQKKGRYYLAVASALERKAKNDGAMRINPQMTWSEVKAFAERMEQDGEKADV